MNPLTPRTAHLCLTGLWSAARLARDFLMSQFASRRPNILLLLTDQQRFDSIAALGNRLIVTPALDGLVRQGTAFTRCYTPSPVCVSARCALITGVPPHRSGCVDNMVMPQNIPSLMERLGALGYQTHGTGKMHFTPDARRMWGFESRDTADGGPGVDDYEAFVHNNGFAHVDEVHGQKSEYYYLPQPSQLPAHLHNSSWVAGKSLEFLARRDRERPFFLWSSFEKPHPPFENPTPWNKLYRAAEMPSPFRPPNFEALLVYWNSVQNRYKYRDAGYDDLLMRTIIAAYYSCISFVDFNIARILKGLGEELDNTLVLFASDHGELLGDYGSVGKRSMLDGAARVPLLARWPGHFAAGQICDEPASLLDIVPTCLAAAGADEPQLSAHGVDLVQLARGQCARSMVISQFQQRGYGLYMATTRQWKYVYSAPDDREWLFDLTRDARETVNRAGNPMFAQTLEKMRAALMEILRADGYVEPLEGQNWKKYPRRQVPANPDAGLLFQDAADTQRRVDALGEYARPVTLVRPDPLNLLATPE